MVFNNVESSADSASLYVSAEYCGGTSQDVLGPMGLLMWGFIEPEKSEDI